MTIIITPYNDLHIAGYMLYAKMLINSGWENEAPSCYKGKIIWL